MAECPPLHIPHKEWANRDELENYLAIERWARCKDEGCTCYVRHFEGVQTYDPPFGGVGERADLVEFDSANYVSENICGTIPSANSMLVMHLRWVWQTSADDPYIVTGPPGLASARFVGVWGEGFDPSNGFRNADGALAIDTRLGTGTEWYSDGLQEGGTLTTPLNIFPNGQGFSIWAGQNSSETLDLDIAVDIYSVCACACPL